MSSIEVKSIKENDEIMVTASWLTCGLKIGDRRRVYRNGMFWAIKCPQGIHNLIDVGGQIGGFTKVECVETFTCSQCKAEGATDDGCQVCGSGPSG